MGAPAWLFEEDLEYDEQIYYFRHEDKDEYKAFFACSSYSRSGKSNELLRRLKRDMDMNKSLYSTIDNRPVLELESENRMLKIDGFSLHRPYATFVSIGLPTSFNANGPFSCCDNHETFSRVAKLEDGIEGLPLWLHDILYDAKQFSKCMPFTEMGNGTYYRYFMWMEKRKEKGIVETKDEAAISFIKDLEKGGEDGSFCQEWGRS